MNFFYRGNRFEAEIWRVTRIHWRQQMHFQSTRLRSTKLWSVANRKRFDWNGDGKRERERERERESNKDELLTDEHVASI